MNIKLTKKNKGQKLLTKAKKIIPGGGQLLSKRSEIFLPEYWPAYYKKAKGYKIWDLNGNILKDFSGMGVLSCVLGYADNEVNNKVLKKIKNASMTSLNDPDEVKLAEMLINLHPWSDMVRFAKTGGEACAIAIRIARAATGKDKVLFCGYHGWQDWYISSNLSNKNNLTDLLLPGLDPKGIPKKLQNTAIPFKWNDYKTFDEALIRNKSQVGVIIMEPERSNQPDIKFLKYIKRKAKEIGAVFIFDEITAGFHDQLGGKHLKLGINPDMAVFSKAMGNGYPIAAIIGVKEVMNYAQNTFISSLMWTESVGLAAAIETIKKMKKHNVQKYLVKYGKKIKHGWGDIANSLNIDIQISGMDSIPEFNFQDKRAKMLHTYLNQEMLKYGFLNNNRLATTYVYNDKAINNYLDHIYKSFKKIKPFVNNNKKIPLLGSVKHSTFKRLN